MSADHDIASPATDLAGYRRPSGICQRDNCTRRVSRRGLCKSHYEYQRRVRVARGERAGIGYTPAARTLEHLRALGAAGLGYKRVAALSGLHPVSVGRIFRQTAVSLDTERRILAVPIPAQTAAWQVAADGAFVDAVGARRRICALVANGHDLTVIREWIREHYPASNIDTSMLSAIAIGKQQKVTARTYRTIADVYDTHDHVRGDSAKARRRAERNAWPGPAAWPPSAIDDPDATPGEQVTFAALVADHRACGRTDDEMAAMFGVGYETLVRRFYRYGIPLGRRWRDHEDEPRADPNNISKAQVRRMGAAS
jgi:hypothetical protein